MHRLQDQLVRLVRAQPICFFDLDDYLLNLLAELFELVFDSCFIAEDLLIGREKVGDVLVLLQNKAISSLCFLRMLRDCTRKLFDCGI